MIKLPLGYLACIFLVLGCVSSFGQSSSGNIRGAVLDSSGATIAGATVEIQNPVSHYQQSVKANGQGAFQFANIPYNNYHLTANASGFQSAQQDVDVRSAVPLDVKITLQVGVATTSVTVESSADLVETDSTTHTDVDRNLFDKLPLESQSSSLSSLVTLASPGVAADSNGLFHGLGDHASNSFSIDGQPISDQQSKVFSNQLPSDAVQSMEVIEGAPPAEYGDKTSLVIVVTTRSGLGQTEPHGEITGSFGSFGTANGGANLAYGGEKLGKFHFLERTGHQPVSGRAGVHRDARSRESGEYLRPGGFEGFLEGHHQPEFRTSREAGSRLRIRYDSQNATAWTGPVCANYLSFSTACNGLGPERPGCGQHGSGIEDQDVQHRAVLDTRDQREYGVHVRRLSPGRINSTTIRAPIRSRTSFRICKPPRSARIAG